MVRALGSDGQPVKLAREADGKIADVDHLLHFALPFGDDFAGFKRNEHAQILFGVTQGVAKLANDFAAFGRWDRLPFFERGSGTRGGAFVLFSRGCADLCQQGTVVG